MTSNANPRMFPVQVPQILQRWEVIFALAILVALIYIALTMIITYMNSKREKKHIYEKLATIQQSNEENEKLVARKRLLDSVIQVDIATINPADINQVEQDVLRSYFECKAIGESDLDAIVISSIQEKLLEPKLKSTCQKKKYRTIFCHDMKGNYLEDRFVYGGRFVDPFQVLHWEMSDIFCYFSHNFITIPPLQWVNVCRRHGKLVIGTLITEWGEGRKRCQEIFGDTTKTLQLASILFNISKLHGLDGWLINIENRLDPDVEVPNVLLFLRELRRQLKEYNEESLVIWYDAVTIEGKLEWQDSLTKLNKPFFDESDGIFVNYTWQKDYPKHSVDFLHQYGLSHRCFDLFFGVDVFGRGAYGGGQYHTNIGVEAVARGGVSLALFAPGWVMENQVKSFKMENENGDNECNPETLETKAKCFSDDVSRYCKDYIKEDNKLFDPISEVWNSYEGITTTAAFKLIRQGPKPKDSKADMKHINFEHNSLFDAPLHFDFSLAMGKKVFLFGKPFTHPFQKTRNLVISDHDDLPNKFRGDFYYDLTMQHMIWSLSIVEKCYKSSALYVHNEHRKSQLTRIDRAKQTKLRQLRQIVSNSKNEAEVNATLNRIKKLEVIDKIESAIYSSMSFDNAFIGSSSLLLSGVIKSTKQQLLTDCISVPISSFNDQSKNNRFMNTCNIATLGSKVNPLIVRLTVCNQSTSCVHIKLRFKSGFDNSSSLSNAQASNGQTRTSNYDKDTIILLDPKVISPATGSSGKAPSRVLEVGGMPITNYTMAFAPSNATTHDSCVMMPNENHIQQVLSLSGSVNNSNNNTNNNDNNTKTQTTTQEQVVALRQQLAESPSPQDSSCNDNHTASGTDAKRSKDLLFKGVSWESREYVLSPVVLTDLTSRELVAVDILCQCTQQGVDSSALDALDDQVNAFRAYVDHIHIDTVPSRYSQALKKRHDKPKVVHLDAASECAAVNRTIVVLNLRDIFANTLVDMSALDQLGMLYVYITKLNERSDINVDECICRDDIDGNLLNIDTKSLSRIENKDLLVVSRCENVMVSINNDHMHAVNSELAVFCLEFVILDKSMRQRIVHESDAFVTVILKRSITSQ